MVLHSRRQFCVCAFDWLGCTNKSQPSFGVMSGLCKQDATITWLTWRNRWRQYKSQRRWSVQNNNNTTSCTDNIGSWDSAVGISTGYGLDDRRVGVRVPVGSRIFSKSFRPALGSIQWVPGALSLGLKRPGREADYPPPASAEVKKNVYISTLPYALMA
jgi:hypothetical protein